MDSPVESACPHCGIDFAKTPKAKTKCKACGEPVYVRGSPIDGLRHLMTARQAKYNDWLHAEEHQRKRVVTRAYDALANIGLSALEFESYGLALGRQLGRTPTLWEQVEFTFKHPNQSFTDARNPA